MVAYNVIFPPENFQTVVFSSAMSIAEHQEFFFFEGLNELGRWI